MMLPKVQPSDTSYCEYRGLAMCALIHSFYAALGNSGLWYRKGRSLGHLDYQDTSALDTHLQFRTNASVSLLNVKDAKDNRGLCNAGILL